MSATLSRWVISCRPIRLSPGLRPPCARSGRRRNRHRRGLPGSRDTSVHDDPGGPDRRPGPTVGRTRRRMVGTRSRPLCGDDAAVGRMCRASRSPVSTSPHDELKRSTGSTEGFAAAASLWRHSVSSPSEPSETMESYGRNSSPTSMTRARKGSPNAAVPPRGRPEGWERVKDEQPDVVMWARLATDPAPGFGNARQHP